MGVRPRSWWQIVRKSLAVVGIIVACVLGITLIVVIALAYIFNVNLPGLHGKTLWDWLQLLIIPVALAIGGYWFTIAQRKSETDKEKRDELHDLRRRFYANVFQAFHDAKKVRRLLRGTAQYLPPDQQVTMILIEPYDKQMQVLIEIQLQFETFVDDVKQENSPLFPKDQPNDQMRNVLKIYFKIIQHYLHAIVKEYENHYKILTSSNTKTALSIYQLPKLKNFIDEKSKRNTFFILGHRVREVLRDQLISEISPLKGATKPGGGIVCDLSEVDLTGEDLSDANLSNAILFNANLSNADLKGANFYKAWVTREQVSKAKSLKGATMPDGSIHT